jgi:hypothetical protein
MPSRPDHDPLAWIKVPEVTEAEGFAIKAFAAGAATEDQQRRAFAFITRRLCMQDESTFVLDQNGGERASCFAAGRRAVALALDVIVKLPTDKLRKPDGE